MHQAVPQNMLHLRDYFHTVGQRDVYENQEWFTIPLVVYSADGVRSVCGIYRNNSHSGRFSGRDR